MKHRNASFAGKRFSSTSGNDFLFAFMSSNSHIYMPAYKLCSSKLKDLFFIFCLCVVMLGADGGGEVDFQLPTPS